MATGDLIYCHGFDALDVTKDGLTAQTLTGGTISESSTQVHTGTSAREV
jgi:hypothetical protein